MTTLIYIYSVIFTQYNLLRNTNNYKLYLKIVVNNYNKIIWFL